MSFHSFFSLFISPLSFSPSPSFLSSLCPNSFFFFITLFSSLSSLNAVNLTDLDPGVDYTVWVRGVTSRLGAPSNVTTVRSGADSITTPPTQLQLALVNQTGVNVTWTAPKKAKSIAGYVIYWWPSVVHGSGDRKSLNVSAGQKTGAALIPHLAPATWYVFSVAAYNDAGHGPEAEAEIQTGGAPLKAPSGLTARLVTPTSFNVSWNATPPPHLDGDGALRWRYRLSWGLTEEELRWHRVETTVPTVLVSHLLSCEKYIFAVQRVASAPNDAGSGAAPRTHHRGVLGPMAKIVGETKSDPAAPPKRPGAKYRKRDKSIYIQWEAPCSFQAGQEKVTYVVNVTDDVGRSAYFKPTPTADRKPFLVIRHNLTRGAHYFITVTTDVDKARPSARIIIEVPPLPEPRNFGLTEIDIEGRKALFFEWETPKGIPKSDNETDYVVWMASKKIVEEDHNDIVATTPAPTHFRYQAVETTKEKRFVFSQLQPAVKYAFRVSVRLPDGRHFGSKSGALFFTAPKDLPPSGTVAPGTFAIPKTSAIVGGLFVAGAVVVCFFLVILYHRRQKRLEASLERLHQSMYDRRAGVTFVNNGEGGDGASESAGSGVAVAAGGGRGRNRLREGGRRLFGRPSGADRMALLDDVGDENEDEDNDGLGNGGVLEAETFQPFQSFSADRNEADVETSGVSEEQMNNERNNALSAGHHAGSQQRRGRGGSGHDDDDALLLADDMDDGPVINAFAFNDEPPMIIA